MTTDQVSFASILRPIDPVGFLLVVEPSQLGLYSASQAIPGRIAYLLTQLGLLSPLLSPIGSVLGVVCCLSADPGLLRDSAETVGRFLVVLQSPLDPIGWICQLGHLVHTH